METGQIPVVGGSTTIFLHQPCSTDLHSRKMDVPEVPKRAAVKTCRGGELSEDELLFGVGLAHLGCGAVEIRYKRYGGVLYYYFTAVMYLVLCLFAEREPPSSPNNRNQGCFYGRQHEGAVLIVVVLVAGTPLCLGSFTSHYACTVVVERITVLACV